MYCRLLCVSFPRSCCIVDITILSFVGQDGCGNSSIVDAGDERLGKRMIVGGWEALPNEFPYLVSLLWFGSHFCGGSIASSRHIITAAHCVEGE